MDSKANILVLCKKASLQNKVLFTHLLEHFNTSLTTLQEFSSGSLPEFSVAIVDQSCLTLEVLTGILTTLNQHPKAPVLAIMNVSTLPDRRFLRTFQNLKGIFQDSDDFDTLVNGIHVLLAGGYHVPPAMVIQLINTASSINPRPSQTNKLTQRELEILDFVKTGATNNEIADQLFLSENTVKTHLYNVYKKLNVRNRAEAIDLTSGKLTTGELL